MLYTMLYCNVISTNGMSTASGTLPVGQWYATALTFAKILARIV